MKGNKMGVYRCDGCDDEFRLSDAFAFAGGFRPAANLDVDGHPMYWRGEA